MSDAAFGTYCLPVRPKYVELAPDGQSWQEIPADECARRGYPGYAPALPGATLLVHDCHCYCAACGYRGQHWIESINRGEAVYQDSSDCPGCGRPFTARRQAPEARTPAPGYLGDYGEAT